MSLSSWFYSSGSSLSGSGRVGVEGIGTSHFLAVNYSPSVENGYPAFSVDHSPSISDTVAPSLKISSSGNVTAESLQIVRDSVGNFALFNYMGDNNFKVDQSGNVYAEGSISGGAIEIPVGNQVLNLEQGNYFYSVPDQSATWTVVAPSAVVGGREGMLVYIQVDNTAEEEITFGSGFTDVDSITDAGIKNKLLYYDLANTTWREIATGGGGGTPGGSDTNVQYNNGGAFDGESYFTYNDSTKVVTINGNLIYDDDRGYVSSLGALTSNLAEMSSNMLLDKSGSILSCSDSHLIYTITAVEGHGLWNFDGVIYPIAVDHADVELVGGTDHIPVINYVYFDLSGGPPAAPVLKRSATEPTVSHICVATFIVGLVSGSSYTLYSYDRNRDETESFISRVIHRLNETGTLYVSGYVTTSDQHSISIAAQGEFFNGIFKMFSNNAVTSSAFYFIDSAGHYNQATTLSQLGFYANGEALGAAERAVIVWGLVPTTTTATGVNPTIVRLVAVLQSKPTVTYKNDADAREDLYEAANYFPPITELRRVFVPICKTIICQTDYTHLKTFDTGVYHKDLRGKIISGGGAATATDLSGYLKADGTTPLTSAWTVGGFAIAGITNLAINASGYLNWNTTIGTSGYGIRDNSGVIEHKDSGGSWAPIGIDLPAGSENQTLRKNSTVWEATSVFEVNSDGPENTVDHSTGTQPRMVNVVYAASPNSLVAANSVPIGTLGIIYIP